MNVSPRRHESCPRGRVCGPLIQLWSHTAAKKALFFDPDCHQPPVSAHYLLSNCPRLNLNSFSISAQLCFVKIHHWEYSSLGGETYQHSMEAASRASYGQVKDAEGAVSLSSPCPFTLGLSGETFLWTRASPSPLSLCRCFPHEFLGKSI